jgi:exosortase/archaeosortase family protein
MLRKNVNALRRYYQYIVAAALVTILILIVYGSDLQILANEALQNEALSHILILPVFAGILFYMKKDFVKASLDLEKYKKTRNKYLDQLIGVAIILIAFLIYWYGSYTFYAFEYHIFSLPIFIIGTTLILLNLRAALTLVLPTLFLLFLVPIPAQVLFSLGGTMANLNSQAAYALLKTFNVPVQMSTAYGPPTLMLTTSQAGSASSFTVDLPCSGIYSLIAFAMLAAFLLLISAGSPFKKLALVTIGFITFEVLNIIRITSIISVAYQFGEETAMTIVHSTVGMLLIFTGMLITLFIGDKLLRIQIIPTAKQQACPQCESSLKKFQDFCADCGSHLKSFKPRLATETYAKLLVLILVAFLVTLSINAPTFAVAKGPNGIAYSASNTAAVNVFPNITGYNPPTFVYRDVQYEKIAQEDASLWYVYDSNNTQRPPIYVDVGVASSINNLHNWEVCYYSFPIAQGQLPTVQVLDQREVQILQETPLIAQYFTFITPYNYTQVTLYWYTRATFNTGVTNEQRYVRISLLILTRNSTAYKQLEDQLLPVSTAVANYWQPLTNNSLISLGIPTIQALLIAAIVIVVLIKTTQTLTEWNKKTNNQKLFNNYATPEEKTLLQAIMALAKQSRKIRTQDIQEALEAGTEKPVDQANLPTMLKHLEEYGFLKKDLAKINNKPYQVWKTSFTV